MTFITHKEQEQKQKRKKRGIWLLIGVGVLAMQTVDFNLRECESIVYRLCAEYIQNKRKKIKCYE